jgi:1-acyl-sn-glycerol-3-phosphate acyltransferase
VRGSVTLTFYDFAKAVVGGALRTVWRLKVHGAERVPRSGPLIVACNHVSYFDPPSLGVALPRPLRYMAKVELFRMPVLGPLITWLNAFPVDRSRGDVAAIKRAVEILRSGAAVGIFPEGTRNKSGDLRPQVGVALLAVLSGAPVLPAYVGGTARAKRLGRIDVAFGEPLQVTRAEKASRDDLAKWADEIMARIYALRETIGAD